MKKRLVAGVDYVAVSTPFYCINEYGELLMHKRSKNCRDEQGTWDTGSGQLEFGQTPEESVLREVKEEYGCTGEIVEELFPISVLRKNNGLDTHWLAIPFIINVKKEEVKINEPEKIDAIGWFTLDNLPQPLHSGLKKYILETDRVTYLKKYISF